MPTTEKSHLPRPGSIISTQLHKSSISSPLKRKLTLSPTAPSSPSKLLNFRPNAPSLPSPSTYGSSLSRLSLLPSSLAAMSVPNRRTSLTLATATHEPAASNAASAEPLALNEDQENSDSAPVRKIGESFASSKPTALTQERAAKRPKLNTSSRTSSATTSTNRPLARNGGRAGAPPRKPIARAPLNTPSAIATSENSGRSDASEHSKKKKRPTWDTKGRLADMESVVEHLEQTIQSSRHSSDQLRDRYERAQEQIAELQRVRAQCEYQLQHRSSECATLSAELAQVKTELAASTDRHAQQLREMASSHLTEVSQAKLARDDAERRLRSTASDLEAVTRDRDAMRSGLSSTSATLAELEARERATASILDATRSDLARQKAELEKKSQRVDELEAELRSAETERRKLHNVIQELKGNIRVFCRVRPLLSRECTAHSLELGKPLPHITFAPDGSGLELIEHRESADGQRTVAKTHPFQFDKVFAPDVRQAVVFEEIAQLIQSALDGYNVCIFAYGQTGSGKTFTMEGVGKPSPSSSASIPDPYADDESGMIPRAVAQIFQSAQDLESKGWEYSFEGSFIEIYNETLRDLLDESADSNKDAKKHNIQHVNGKTIVTDATVVPVASPAQVREMLQRASRNRAVAATLMNERSSRSHSVFTLQLSGKNPITGENCDGRIHLVDLAGSERLAQSGATGDRLKETQAINKSLSSLGDVIMALANRDAHIPYRNSKLTFLLQNSLGGNSKTLMFVNVSPLPSSLNETVNSLRFATKVNSCQIGTAVAKKTIK